MSKLSAFPEKLSTPSSPRSGELTATQTTDIIQDPPDLDQGLLDNLDNFVQLNELLIHTELPIDDPKDTRFRELSQLVELEGLKTRLDAVKQIQNFARRLNENFESPYLAADLCCLDCPTQIAAPGGAFDEKGVKIILADKDRDIFTTVGDNTEQARPGTFLEVGNCNQQILVVSWIVRHQNTPQKLEDGLEN
jgi:hypothetical protein